MDIKSARRKMKLKTALKEIDQKGDHTKEYNLTMKGKKITLEEESNMSEKVWTKSQQEYLDKRFGALESDVAILKEDVTQLKEDVKRIETTMNSKFDILFNHLGIK